MAFRISHLPDLFHNLTGSGADSAADRLVIAQNSLADAVLPRGVVVTPAKLRSRRTAVKGPRPFANIRAMTARWPQDALMEAKGIPKLVYVVQGQVDFPVGQYVIHCGEGSFILCPSGLPHPDGTRPHLDDERQRAGAGCSLVWCQAWEAGIRIWSCHSCGAEHRYEDKRHLFILNEQLNQVFKLLAEEAEARGHGHKKICEGLLAAFVTMVDRELRSGQYHFSYSDFQTESPVRTVSKSYDPISMAQEYVLSHLGQHLTTEQVARRVLISRAQFTKRFRREVGKTFVEFLSESRLDYAKNLLRESDWTAGDISQQAGFRSYSYFGQLFKSRLGMTPSEFRELTRSTAHCPDDERRHS